MTQEAEHRIPSHDPRRCHVCGLRFLVYEEVLLDEDSEEDICRECLDKLEEGH